MISSFFNESPTDLLKRTQEIHSEITRIHNEQIRSLQIQLAILEDENKRLKERLKEYENNR